MRALSWVIVSGLVAAASPALAQPTPGSAPTATAAQPPPATPAPTAPPTAQPPPTLPPGAPPSSPPPPSVVAPNEVPGAWQPAPPTQPSPVYDPNGQPYPPAGQGYPPQGAPPPGYGPAGFPGYPPVGPPPPPLPPKEPSCCRFAIRFDPFNLIFRRLSFQAELVIWGPLSIEAEPSWIFGSATENLDVSGGALQGNFLVYFTGRGLNGFFAKATVGFEKFTATLTDPDLPVSDTNPSSRDLMSPILGLGIGSSNVFGDTFGFNLAGGVGIGFATAEKQELTAGRFQATFYDKGSAIQLLASLGLGFAF